jgi:hypothetical protein
MPRVFQSSQPRSLLMIALTAAATHSNGASRSAFGSRSPLVLPPLLPTATARSTSQSGASAIAALDFHEYTPTGILTDGGARTMPPSPRTSMPGAIFEALLVITLSGQLK